MDAIHAHRDGTAEPIVRYSAIAFAILLLLAAAVMFGEANWDFSRTQRSAASLSSPNASRSRVPLSDGKTCRELIFNRVTGQILEANDAPCSAPAELTRRAPGNFVWGGSK